MKKEVNIAVMVPGAVEIFCAAFNGFMTVVISEVREHGSCDLWVDSATGRWACDSESGEGKIYVSAIPDKSLSIESLTAALEGVDWCVEVQNNSVVTTISFGNINSVVIGEDDD